MSFSSQAKTELTAILPDSPCCLAAELYGMLEFGHAFSGAEISLQTESEPVADLYRKLVERVCSVPVADGQVLRRRTALYTRQIATAEDRRRVLERFGHTPSDLTVRLNRANLDCDHCARALLRGAFLVCGAVTDPARDYHLEFSVPYYNLSRDLLTLLDEVGFPAKVVVRNGSYVIYLKESERIEDCLTFLGASRAALEMMSIKVVKSIRNETNRRTNCENANIDKTVNAAAAQTQAVRRIEKSGKLESLPPALRELARVRLDHPELSLRELGALLDPPLSRSGVNHRLQRLLEIAADLPS